MKSIIRFSAVGDINLGDRAIMVGLGVGSKISKGIDYDPFSFFKPISSACDITFGNLECVLSKKNYDTKNIKFKIMRSNPENNLLLKNGGFNLLSIANNHIMQHGDACFYDTVGLLRNSGILPVGLADQDGKCLPQFIVVKGLRFGILGYCLRPEKYARVPLYAYGGLSTIYEQIRDVRKECDFVIVSLHWGDEYIEHPSGWQINAARAMINHGANAIIGHHPHVLQGIERYKNGVIAYSLGNFVFDVWQKRLRESAVLEIDFSRKGIEDVRCNHFYIGADFIPRPVTGRREVGLKIRQSNLDDKLRKYPYDPSFFNYKYKKRVLLHEFINKIQNRIFFLVNYFNYDKKFFFQSLKEFFKSRV